MNYFEFYKRATEELKSTFLFLHGRGDASYSAHMEDMLNVEPLVRKPIFQSIFPWEQCNSTMDGLQNLVGRGIVDALDNVPDADLRFPRDRHPYLHQEKAWQAALTNNKSILITTGTGSGKTECFMVPVLKELYESKQQDPDVGIQAIFLYPLNALMDSQRLRIKAWSEQLTPQVSFCIYNSELRETADQNYRQEAAPEVIDRASMRNTPPQMLFTNPSMLEYMMVRPQDGNLQTNSDLKWIVLDEAHVYNGSSATELALQIKRILIFFGKTPNQVKFAIASATIDNNPANASQMHKFIEDLTGKPWTDFEVISGSRVIPALDYAHPNTIAAIQNINNRWNLNLNGNIIDALRTRLNSNNNSQLLTLDEIAAAVGMPNNASREDKIHLVDALSTQETNPVMTISQGGTALLPTRAHFYVRSVEGIYCCTNPNCPQHNAYSLDLGHLTTYKYAKCPHCGGQMLEVVKCSQCGELLLQADTQHGNAGANDTYTISKMNHDDDWFFDDESNSNNNNQSIIFDSSSRIQNPPAPQVMNIPFGLDEQNSLLLRNGNRFVKCINNNGKCVCPKCGEEQSSISPIILSANMIQTHLAPILLHQSSPMDSTNNADLVYDGRKYISFTDNRMKTAKTARLQNIDVERRWIRGAIYHILNYLGDCRACEIRQRLTEYESNEFDKLYNHFSNLHPIYAANADEYFKSLLVDQTATRSLRSALSIETLGLAHWRYPSIENITQASLSFCQFYGYNNSRDLQAVEEWKNLLKYFIDITIRGGRHILIEQNLDNILPHRFFTNPIYAHQNRRNNDREYWLHMERQNGNNPYRREIVMMLLANNITDMANVTNQVITDINRILDDVWAELINLGILTGQNGYYLNLFDDNSPALLTLQTSGVQCPVTKQIVNYTFRGVSPLIKGNLCQETLDRYTIHQQPMPIPIPTDITTGDYTDPNDNTIFNEQGWRTAINDWIENTYIPNIELHWGDANSQKAIIAFDKVFIASEHSAQINSAQLRQSEQDLANGQLNVLNCSTTMEMGVDIGGLSIVTMNNVPPKPQNYQQRVGRAGRRSEVKAMAMTIYSDNPIGKQLENNPTWVLSHTIEPPIVATVSENIVQRHVNALLFGYFLSSQQNFTLRDRIGDFVAGFNHQNGKPHYSYLDYVQTLQDWTNNLNLPPQLVAPYKSLVRGTCLQNASFTTLVDNAKVSIQKIGDYIRSYLNIDVNTPNQRYYMALVISQKKLWDNDMLTYLGQHDYLPNAYMPTNVTDFVLQGSNDFNSYPQRETHLAISEYAPGKEIVVGEMVYKSIGISMNKAANTAAPIIEYVSQCPNCHYVTKQYVGANNNVCPICGGQLQPILHNQPERSTRVVSPLSFLSDQHPKRGLNHDIAPSFITPHLLDMQQHWPATTNNAYMTNTPIGEASILYVNDGEGYGFALCPECGRMEVEQHFDDGNPNHLPAAFGIRRGRAVQHTRADNLQQNCDRRIQVNGNGINITNQPFERNVCLIAEIKTNITQIKVMPHTNSLTDDEQKILLNSLGTIMSRKYAEMLGVEDDEIAYGISGVDTFFIYDTHSGGSCYSNKLSDSNLMEKLLNKCRDSLNTCNCSKACTNCLIDRRSQYNIENLNRNIALAWLNWEKQQRNVIPQNLALMFPNQQISHINVPIEQKIQHLMLDTFAFNTAEYFLDSRNEDSFDIFHIIAKDMQRAVQVYDKQIQIDLDIDNLSLQDLLDLMPFDPNIYQYNWTQYTNLSPVLQTDRELYVKYIDNNIVNYYVVANGNINRLQQGQISPNQQLLNRRTCMNLIHETSFDINNYLSKILGTDLANLDNYINNNNFQNSHISVSYTDIYVKSPAACILACSVLKQFAQRYNLTIDSFEVLTTDRFDSFDPAPNLLTDNFNATQERDDYLANCVLNILGINPDDVLQITTNRLLPHYRSLQIKGFNTNLNVEIQPNGGFANGWWMNLNRQPATINANLSSNFFMINRQPQNGICYTSLWG